MEQCIFVQRLMVKKIIILNNGEVSYIHFDAKYRVSDITSLVGKDVDTASRNCRTKKWMRL
jgi:hypothetical protein